MYAIVTDVTPNRATVLYAGTATEVVEALDGQVDGVEVPEDHRIVAIVDRPRAGERIWHSEGWIHPDSLR
jgi:hypothetical protein